MVENILDIITETLVNTLENDDSLENEPLDKQYSAIGLICSYKERKINMLALENKITDDEYAEILHYTRSLIDIYTRVLTRVAMNDDSKCES